MNNTIPPLIPATRPIDEIIESCNEVQDSDTDPALAHGITSNLGGRASAVFDRAQVRIWDEGLRGWALILLVVLLRAASAFDGKFVNRGDKLSRIRLNNPKSKGIVEQVQNNIAAPGFFDDAPRGAAFRNLFLRVEGQTVIQEAHHPSHRNLAEHVRPYDYFTDVTPEHMPVFWSFLQQSWAGCADVNERIQYFFEYLGAAILGLTWRYKDNPVFVGPKDTGKSVLLAIVGLCFPAGTITNVTWQAMGEKFGLAPLMNASVNIVTELPAARMVATEKLKALLAGDLVGVERKNKDVIPFRCLIGHFFAANEMPQVRDPALRGRFVVLDFPNVVPQESQDRLLVEKIRKEIPYIVSYAIDAAVNSLLVRGRFQRPLSAVGEARRWAQESDSVLAWVAEGLSPGAEHDFVPTAQLHGFYRAWCAEQGLKPIIKAKFGQRLSQAGFEARNRGGRGFLVQFIA